MISDTDPKAEKVLLDLLRKAPPWRKLEMMCRLNQTARELAVKGVEQRFPDATPNVRRYHLAELLLGDELAARVYGHLLESGDELRADDYSEKN